MKRVHVVPFLRTMASHKLASSIRKNGTSFENTDRFNSSLLNNNENTNSSLSLFTLLSNLQKKFQSMNFLTLDNESQHFEKTNWVKTFNCPKFYSLFRHGIKLKEFFPIPSFISSSFPFLQFAFPHFYSMTPAPEAIPKLQTLDEDSSVSASCRLRPPSIETDALFLTNSLRSTSSLIDSNLFTTTVPNALRRSSSGLTTPTHRYMETFVCARETAKYMGKARLKIGVPENILIVTKFHDPQLVPLTKELTLWLIDTQCDDEGNSVTVYVDERMQGHAGFEYLKLTSSSALYSKQIKFWTPELCEAEPDLFDVVISLGGDGTVLYTSWLFQKHVPPVVAFHLGSLGFLTVFDFVLYPSLLQHIFYQELLVNMHMRLECTIYRNPNPAPSSPCHVFDSPDSNITMTASPTFSTMLPLHARKEETFQVLNELVVDRGPSAYMSQLELFGDENHLTTVQADGLAVSTPTGSTAYSLSAGGSLVHPQVSTILVTPICPHTLSFRPMLLPDSMDLRILVPPTSRSTAWASFDGRNRIELKQGDYVVVSASKHPFPTVCRENQSNDWFNSLSRCLKWNERRRQLAFRGLNNSADS